MKKLNSILLYLLAACFFTFTACDDDEVTPEPPQTQTPDPTDEEEEVPTEEESTEEEEDETVAFDTVGFEGLVFPEGADAFYGQDKSGENLGAGQYGGTVYGYTYTSGPGILNLRFTETETYTTWSRTAYSRQTDNTLTGPEGQFVAMPAEGANDSEVYAIVNGKDTISFEYETGTLPQSIQITNNAYAYYSMKNGDQFAKKFGGVEGTDPDYFKVIITGLDEENNEISSLEVYLADFRSDDGNEDYILDSWEKVDLTPLGTVNKLAFSLESSDVGDYGMNTPAYFVFDELVVEPVTVETE